MQADPDEEDPIDRGGRNRKRRGDFDEGKPAKIEFNTDNCWFCLSNANAEKHLIVSVGKKAYAAMPKGPLTEDHVMVLSIQHVQSMAVADADLRAEIAAYRDAFALMADAADKTLVAFERNFKCSHLQLQLIPVPKTNSRALRMAFLVAAQDHKIELGVLEKDQQIWDIVEEGHPYFYAELPDGTRLLCTKMRNFPIHFGREVLASPELLDCLDKVDWKNCVLEHAKEAEVTNDLKARFKQYDIVDESDSED
uniref:CwfJ_C_1 domain-containing protein n=1 Tax=Panagrellus redivivus TaxID=6233 RepID=A0A7E5A247_PANRE